MFYTNQNIGGNHMLYIITFLGLILGYLSGSISYARLFARIGKGIDITKTGNGNPGTSNVMREVGVFWGSLTLVFDCLKGMIVMVLVQALFFTKTAIWPVELPFGGAEVFAITLIAIA